MKMTQPAGQPAGREARKEATAGGCFYRRKKNRKSHANIDKLVKLRCMKQYAKRAWFLSFITTSAFPKKIRKQKRTPETRACAQNPPSGVDPKQRKRAGTPRLRTESTFRDTPKKVQKRILDGNSDDLSLPKIANGRPSAAESIFLPRKLILHAFLHGLAQVKKQR